MIRARKSEKIRENEQKKDVLSESFLHLLLRLTKNILQNQAQKDFEST